MAVKAVDLGVDLLGVARSLDLGDAEARLAPRPRVPLPRQLEPRGRHAERVLQRRLELHHTEGRAPGEDRRKGETTLGTTCGL